MVATRCGGTMRERGGTRRQPWRRCWSLSGLRNCASAPRTPLSYAPGLRGCLSGMTPSRPSLSRFASPNVGKAQEPGGGEGGDRWKNTRSAGGLQACIPCQCRPDTGADTPWRDRPPDFDRIGDADRADELARNLVAGPSDASEISHSETRGAAPSYSKALEADARAGGAIRYPRSVRAAPVTVNARHWAEPLKSRRGPYDKLAWHAHRLSQGFLALDLRHKQRD